MRRSEQVTLDIITQVPNGRDENTAIHVLPKKIATTLSDLPLDVIFLIGYRFLTGSDNASFRTCCRVVHDTVPLNCLIISSFRISQYASNKRQNVDDDTVCEGVPGFPLAPRTVVIRIEEMMENSGHDRLECHDSLAVAISVAENIEFSYACTWDLDPPFFITPFETRLASFLSWLPDNWQSKATRSITVTFPYTPEESISDAYHVCSSLMYRYPVFAHLTLRVISYADSKKKKNGDSDNKIIDRNHLEAPSLDLSGVSPYIANQLYTSVFFRHLPRLRTLQLSSLLSADIVRCPLASLTHLSYKVMDVRHLVLLLRTLADTSANPNIATLRIGSIVVTLEETNSDLFADFEGTVNSAKIDVCVDHRIRIQGRGGSSCDHDKKALVSWLRALVQNVHVYTIPGSMRSLDIALDRRLTADDPRLWISLSRLLPSLRRLFIMRSTKTTCDEKDGRRECYIPDMFDSLEQFECGVHYLCARDAFRMIDVRNNAKCFFRDGHRVIGKRVSPIACQLMLVTHLAYCIWTFIRANIGFSVLIAVFVSSSCIVSRIFRDDA